MVKRHLLLSVLATVCLGGTLQANSTSLAEHFAVPVSSTEKLKRVMDDYFQYMQKANPEFATDIGLTREYNALWTEHTQEAYTKIAEHTKDYIERLEGIDIQDLSPADKINHQLLLKHCKVSLEGQNFGMHVLAIDHLSGIPLEVQQTIQSMPRNDKLDYQNILSRLKGIPVLLDQTIALLETGIEKGITTPQIVLRTLPQSLLNMIPADVESSMFYEPFKAYPEAVGDPVGIGEADQKAFSVQAYTVVRDEVYPAYQKFHDYLVKTYIPACRQTIGAASLPNGSDWYQYCVRMRTTTELSAEEIHEIGCSEVKRIRGEIQNILTESRFEGTISDYYEYMNTDPQFFYSNSEELLAGYRALTHYIDGQLDQLFGRKPKLPFEVVPMPSHLGEGQISAYYMRGSTATGRPGRFYANTNNVSRRPKWQMESLSLHEAVPGHHFQISIAQEIEGLPEFRKYTGYTAYIEGWGLYCESLGGMIGLDRTPSAKIGRLVEEMWRAVRLVVDTGIHALGWKREDAISYFMAQTGMNEREVTTEVDRYIVWPGQALAYKIGELAIKRWREEAKEVLGDAFDIREFHDALLEVGALPLDVCDQHMKSWMSERSLVGL